MQNILKVTVFWDVTLYSLLALYCPLEGQRYIDTRIKGPQCWKTVLFTVVVVRT